MAQLTQGWDIKPENSNHSMKYGKKDFSLHKVQLEHNLSLMAVGASL